MTGDGDVQLVVLVYERRKFMNSLVGSLALILFLSQPLAAQMGSGKKLSETEKEGQRLFLQRCSVCHLGVPPEYETYGPSLSKEVVADIGEEDVRELIRLGSGRGSKRMPGFQYGLKQADIDKIVAYLKTMEKK